MNVWFVDVILPLPVPLTYTYRVPQELNDTLAVGKRVVVQFGKQKLYSAIIAEVHQKAPKAYTAKYLHNVLDDFPIVSKEQLKFWEWISNYYLCHVGEVMAAALPTGFKMSSESKIIRGANPPDFDELTDREYMVMEALENNPVLTIAEVSQILDLKVVYPILKSLLEKQFIALEEEVKERYKPRMVSLLRLTEGFRSEDQLNKAFELTTRSAKQQDALMKYMQLSEVLSGEAKEVKKVSLQKSANVSSAVIQKLVEKGIVEVYEKEEDRIGRAEVSQDFNALNTDQEKAIQSIRSSWKDKAVCLLHGVTGSGKTEVYIHLIKAMIEEGKQVLYLLPEIALTTQIIQRLQRVFGDAVGVYHSKFNQNERAEVWLDVLNKGRFKVIIGARSAMFLPFSDLGLVIVDEEHESSFKQYDPAPRYNGRDASIVLANQFGAKVLLGTATPAVETYFNATHNKYGLVELNNRHSGVQMPEILVADLKQEKRKKTMRNHFSELLVTHMEEALERKEQIILFQNRRGFSPYIICETCGWSPECTRCDVNLTYHKYLGKLKCHYCGFQQTMPKACPACGSNGLKLDGFGTEKIEEDISLFFPKVKVARLDLETTRSKNAYAKILNDFQDRQIDILIGTQMVSKGLDFDHVSLVGILNADQMLNFQNFRAHERSFQLMAQVAGRAGRKEKRGKVIIQSHNPYHPIIRQVIDGNFTDMYKQQVLERKNFNYPPFHRLYQFTFVHVDREKVLHAATWFTKGLKNMYGERVLGPEYPPISRIKNKYHMVSMLKVERTLSLNQTREKVNELLMDYHNQKNIKQVRVIIDVDPQ